MIKEEKEREHVLPPPPPPLTTLKHSITGTKKEPTPSPPQTTTQNTHIKRTHKRKEKQMRKEKQG